MSGPQMITGLGTLFCGLGMWLLLPGGVRRTGWIGAVLGLIGLGLFAANTLRLSTACCAEDLVFWTLAGLTIIAAAATVSFHNPVYCAIWFALSLLGTAGLFVFQGAQFLGVATIVVYAGAILVTFLFVLMLANPEGHAYYDRLGWEPLLSAATGAVLVGLLTMTISSLALGDVKDHAAPPTGDAKTAANSVLTDEHVASLGGQLFSKQIVGVEVAGTLLLVALVGAVAIIAHDKRARHGHRKGHSPASDCAAHVLTGDAVGPGDPT